MVSLVASLRVPPRGQAPQVRVADALTPPWIPCQWAPGSDTLSRDAAACSLPCALRPLWQQLVVGGGGRREPPWVPPTQPLTPAVPGHHRDVCFFSKHPVSFISVSNYLQLTGEASFTPTTGFQ